MTCQCRLCFQLLTGSDGGAPPVVIEAMGLQALPAEEQNRRYQWAMLCDAVARHFQVEHRTEAKILLDEAGKLAGAMVTNLALMRILRQVQSTDPAFGDGFQEACRNLEDFVRREVSQALRPAPAVEVMTK